jgi:copper transport protein
MLAPSNPVLRPRARRRAMIATLVVIFVSALGLATGGSPVSAHTAFAGSTPANGSVVADPVSEILIEFTNPSTEAGDGFVVLDPTGQIREPSAVTTDDGTVFRLEFDPALSGGKVGVRWSVRAGDAHPIEGSFSFTVGDDAPATAIAAGRTIAGDPSAMPDDEMAATESADMSAMSAEEMAAMNDFLEVDQSRPGESLARLGRLISIAAIVVGIGALAFAATTMRGSLAEIGVLVNAIRVLGLVIVVGAAAEYLGVARIAGDALASAWSTSAGAATAMRALAGLAIAFGVAATTAPIRSPRRARSLSAGANSSLPSDLESDYRATLTTESRTSRPTTDDDEGGETVTASDIAGDAVFRWRPDRSSRLALFGVGLAVASFWFDGHTVTEGVRPLHALANSVHVVAGSVWVGGVITMATVLWSRHRRDRPTDALGLVVRFSAVASLALGAVVAAGLIMAVSILDSFGELTSTPWGQTFLLKTAATGIAIVAGGYNHFRLMPALERDPDNRALHDSVRSTVTAEAIMLAFVIVVTAWLVAAAT